jgi:hypothetical protein
VTRHRAIGEFWLYRLVVGAAPVKASAAAKLGELRSRKAVPPLLGAIREECVRAEEEKRGLAGSLRKPNSFRDMDCLLILQRLSEDGVMVLEGGERFPEKGCYSISNINLQKHGGWVPSLSIYRRMASRRGAGIGAISFPRGAGFNAGTEGNYHAG